MQHRRSAWSRAFAGIAVSCLGLGLVQAASAPPAAATGSGLHGNGSIDEAWLTGAGPGKTSVTLLRNGAPVSNSANPGTADALGSLIIRELTSGAGYSWHDTTTGETTPTFSVLAPGVNPADRLGPLHRSAPAPAGLNYITMRDGIQLAATVRYPYGGTCSATAPCPTVIEYSGYDVAGPTDPIPSLLGPGPGHHVHNAAGIRTCCPTRRPTSGRCVARVSGFATVSLQMRGTGCSGGAFDLFGYPSDYDAYDAIEIVAHQDWVANHKVGMVGISYSGLSQLPSAGHRSARPGCHRSHEPDRRPLLHGLSRGHLQRRVRGRVDRPADRRRQARSHPDAAGSSCPCRPRRCQVSGSRGSTTRSTPSWPPAGELHRPAWPTRLSMISRRACRPSSARSSWRPGTGSGRDPSLFDRRSMSQWATRIKVPVFISGAMEDEQTGPQWPALLSRLPEDDARLRQSGQRRSHRLDRSTDHQPLARVPRHLRRRPASRPRPMLIESTILDEFTSFASGTSAQAPLPRSAVHDGDDCGPGASRVRQQTPRVEVLFDNGAGAVGAGDPQSTYSAGFCAVAASGDGRRRTTSAPAGL